MNNQDRYIPEHMKQRWDEVTGELAVVSELRHEAEGTYYQMILDRIASTSEGASMSDDYHLAAEDIEQLVEANRRYNQLIIARLALSDELKQWQMQTHLNRDVA